METDSAKGNDNVVVVKETAVAESIEQQEVQKLSSIGQQPNEEESTTEEETETQQDLETELDSLPPSSHAATALASSLLNNNMEASSAAVVIQSSSNDPATALSGDAKAVTEKAPLLATADSELDVDDTSVNATNTDETTETQQEDATDTTEEAADHHVGTVPVLDGAEPSTTASTGELGASKTNGAFVADDGYRYIPAFVERLGLTVTQGQESYATQEILDMMAAKEPSVSTETTEEESDVAVARVVPTTAEQLRALAQPHEIAGKWAVSTDFANRINGSKEEEGDIQWVPLSGEEDSLVDGDHLDEDDSEIEDDKKTLSHRWSGFVNAVHIPILFLLQSLSRASAKYPRITILLVILTTVVVTITGYMTNFELDLDERKLFTPLGSDPVVHSEWSLKGSRRRLQEETESFEGTGFKDSPRNFLMLFHSDGEDVLSRDNVVKVFDVLDAVYNETEYFTVCENRDNRKREKRNFTCDILGIPRFWNNSRLLFEEMTTDDQDTIEQMSEVVYLDEFPALTRLNFGYAEREFPSNILTAAQSFVVTLRTPQGSRAKRWELDAVEVVQRFNNLWTDFSVEAQAEGSIGEEFRRSITDDIPLVPAVFVVMSLFVAMVYVRKNSVQSRSLLGISAVIATFLSIATGFGILFWCGVPFTNITQLLPFVIVGIGLDDAFIIMGAYERTDITKDPVERIADTVDEIGLSITLTTLTSMTAFALGNISSVPAVKWLCLYAAPTIMIVFLYQMTFFVACIVLDERRIRADRGDCWVCFCRVQQSEGGNQSPDSHFSTRLMHAYAKVLVKKPVKLFVVLAFTGLLGACIHSALQFEPEFDYTEVLPRDSYVTRFLNAAEAYREVDPIDIYVYFRFVDQSDPGTQEQMQSFVKQLTRSEYVADKVGFFWLDHFRLFKRIQGYRLDGLTFDEQIDLFLEDPTFGTAYRDDFERSEDGRIVSSRMKLDLEVEADDVDSQVKALHDIREITERQPINRGKTAAEQAFFTYDGIYKLWEFFSIVDYELLFTAIIGVVAVTVVAFLFIPHWSAACFVFPMVVVLYVDLCGALQWAGVHLNAISYVSLTMSIGLLVDFVVHILFRFYEVPGNRTEKTIEMLRTMGASILLGGTTTFLGTLPLMFTVSDVFRTVFWAFFGIVTIGMGHGLILLPVLLSTFGPETQIILKKSKRKSQDNDAHDTCSDSNEGLSPPPSPINQTSYGDYLVAGYIAAVNSFTKTERVEL